MAFKLNTTTRVLQGTELFYNFGRGTTNKDFCQVTINLAKSLRTKCCKGNCRRTDARMDTRRTKGKSPKLILCKAQASKKEKHKLQCGWFTWFVTSFLKFYKTLWKGMEILFHVRVFTNCKCWSTDSLRKPLDRTF